MARITIKTYGSCTQREKQELEKLTLKVTTSAMKMDIIQSRRNHHLMHCFLARCEGVMVGWAVVFPALLSNTDYGSVERLGDIDTNNAYFYVHPRYRKRGIGKQLVQRIDRWLGQHNTTARGFAWDDRSDKFYSDKETEHFKVVEL